MNIQSTPDDPRLLVTSTKEPFQPVRIYYSIPDKPFIIRVFNGLRCVGLEAGGRAWDWLYQNEATALTFSAPYEDVPAEIQPVLLGRFKFPEKTRMVLEVRSIPRACEAAKFFGPILGPKVVARRIRIVNRLFNGSEVTNGLDRLDRLLDTNVTVIDPAKAESEMEQALAGAKTPREKRLAFEALGQRSRRQDVPMVEDFPLAPEEETPEFRHLAMTLQFRAVRAYRHWKGETHLTLADVIHEVINVGVQNETIQDVPWPDE